MLIIPASASRTSACRIAGEKIRITEMELSELDVYAVTIDGEEVFPALLLPGEWNGFRVPVFTRETVEDIANFFRASYARPVNGVMTVPAGVSVTYDGVNDTFTFATPDDYENVPEVFDAVNIGGRVFYGIGAGSWSWQKMEEEAYDAIQLFSKLYEEIGSLQMWLDETEYEARMKEEVKPASDVPNVLREIAEEEYTEAFAELKHAVKFGDDDELRHYCRRMVDAIDAFKRF